MFWDSLRRYISCYFFLLFIQYSYCINNSEHNNQMKPFWELYLFFLRSASICIIALSAQRVAAHTSVYEKSEKKTRRKRTIDWPVRKHKNGSDETYAFCRYSCWYEIGILLSAAYFRLQQQCQLATSSLSFFRVSFPSRRSLFFGCW